MNLLNRIKDVVVADVNRFLDERERKNPTAMLNQLVRNCEHEVKKVENLLKKRSELSARLFGELEEAMGMKHKRARHLDLAKTTGEDELVAMATEELAHFTARTESLGEAYEIAKQDEYETQLQLDTMRDKLKDLHARRDEILEQEKKEDEPVVNLKTEKGVSHFTDIEEKIAHLEALIKKEAQRMTFDERMDKLERELAEANATTEPVDVVVEEKSE